MDPYALVGTQCDYSNSLCSARLNRVEYTRSHDYQRHRQEQTAAMESQNHEALCGGFVALFLENGSTETSETLMREAGRGTILNIFKNKSDMRLLCACVWCLFLG